MYTSELGVISFDAVLEVFYFIWYSRFFPLEVRVGESLGSVTSVLSWFLNEYSLVSSVSSIGGRKSVLGDSVVRQ